MAARDGRDGRRAGHGPGRAVVATLPRHYSAAGAAARPAPAGAGPDRRRPRPRRGVAGRRTPVLRAARARRRDQREDGPPAGDRAARLRGHQDHGGDRSRAARLRRGGPARRRPRPGRGGGGRGEPPRRARRGRLHRRLRGALRAVRGGVRARPRGAHALHGPPRPRRPRRAGRGGVPLPQPVLPAGALLGGPRQGRRRARRAAARARSHRPAYRARAVARRSAAVPGHRRAHRAVGDPGAPAGARDDGVRRAAGHRDHQPDGPRLPHDGLGRHPRGAGHPRQHAGRDHGAAALRHLRRHLHGPRRPLRGGHLRGRGRAPEPARHGDPRRPGHRRPRGLDLPAVVLQAALAGPGGRRAGGPRPARRGGAG